LSETVNLTNFTQAGLPHGDSSGSKIFEQNDSPWDSPLIFRKDRFSNIWDRGKIYLFQSNDGKALSFAMREFVYESSTKQN